MQNLIKILRDYRFSKNGRHISQEYLAEELGVNQAKVSRMERAGLDKLDYKYLQKLAKFFEFDTIDEMIKWRPEELMPCVDSTKQTPSEDNGVSNSLSKSINNESLQIVIELDGTEGSLTKAIEILKVNHAYLKNL